MTETKFAQTTSFWRNKFNQQGRNFTGRQNEDMLIQTKRIETLVKGLLQPSDWFEDALDLGCGWGRLLPCISPYCGHIWAVDVLPELSEKVRTQVKNASSITLQWPIRLPRAVDFLLAVFIFQHITDDGLMRAMADEVKRVVKPGARVVILDNAQDHAPHVRPRDPQILSALLGLKAGCRAGRVTVNQRPNDHWLIDGVKN